MRDRVPMSPGTQNCPQHWVSWQSYLSGNWLAQAVTHYSCQQIFFAHLQWARHLEMEQWTKKMQWSTPSLSLIKMQVGGGIPQFSPPEPKESIFWETSSFSYLETELRVSDGLLCVRDCKMHKDAISSNFHNHHRRFLLYYRWENWVSEKAKSLLEVTLLLSSLPETVWSQSACFPTATCFCSTLASQTWFH